MASTKKRKRQADDSFRKNFRELRDTGAPDTGPKRPKNQRIVSLTPSGAASSGRGGRSSGGRGRERGGREKERERGGREKEREGGGRKEERDSRKEGRGGRRGRGRRSLGAQTPRTRLRTDIRDLITSAVERGDVTPVPPRTELTPNVQHTPRQTYQQDSGTAEINTRQSLSTTVNTEIEVARGAELDNATETHIPLAAAPGTPADIETPAQESRVLRSALKGVHSLSSLRKRSLLSHTPFSVTFRDNVTVTEYSPENGGPNSDFSLGSSSSSSSSSSLSTPSPSPLTHRPTPSAVAVGDGAGLDEALEPLEEEDEHQMEDEEDREEDEEDEEEGEEVKVRLRTPHLVEKPPSPSPRLSKGKQSAVRPKKAVSKGTRKIKSTVADKASHSRQAKTLSRALIKNLFMLSGKKRMTTDAAALVVKFSEVYLKRCSRDLAEYASHAGRKTLDVEDAILLMKRQRFISDSETFEYLVHTHLPLEYVEELLPCAVAGKKIVPTRVK